MFSRSSFGSTLRTTVLLATLAGILVVGGRLLGGPTGMVFGLGLAVVMNLGAYWFSDKIVLGMSGAKQVSQSEAPELYALVAELAARAKLPMPRLYIINDPSPNAFATGRNPEHAAVAVNTGLLNLLGRDELAGVIAHELAHVRHRDTLISAVAATIAGAITLIANMAQWAFIFGGANQDDEEGGAGSLLGSLLMIFLAPIAAMIIQLAISRSREYAADAGGARISGSPLALASALRKLERGAQAIPSARANPSTAHMYIVNPFAGAGAGLAALFSTHPPVQKRVERLEAMALHGDSDSFAYLPR